MNAILNLLMLILYFILDDGKKEVEEVPLKEIVIENHNEGFYAWMKDTNIFVGQGNTPEELFELIRAKFPKLDFKLKWKNNNNDYEETNTNVNG
jgi:hypothetical protein